MSLFDKASAIASTLAAKAKAAAMNVSEIEMKVLEATNLDPWGPHGTLMADIARAAFNTSDYALIMAVLEQRLLCTGPQWRHVYKSLLVLEYMAKRGPMRVVEYLRASQSMLTRMNEDFAYRDENGRDQGINVRERAKHIMALVNDDARLKAERDKAEKNAGKYTGVSSAGVSHSGPSSPRQPQVVGRRGEDDPIEATRQRIERLKADGALPDAPAGAAGDVGEGEGAPKARKKLSEVRVNPAISAAISSMPIAAGSSLSSQSSLNALPPPPAGRASIDPFALDLLSDGPVPAPAPAASTAMPLAAPAAAAAAADDDWSNFAAAPPAAAPRPRIDVDAMLNLSAPAPAAKGGALPLDAFCDLPPSRGALLPPPQVGVGAAPGMFGPPLGAPAPAAAPLFDPFAPSPAAAPMPYATARPPAAAAPAAFDPFAPSSGAPAPSWGAAPPMPLTADALLKPVLPAAPKPKLGPETAAQKRKSDPFADLLAL